MLSKDDPTGKVAKPLAKIVPEEAVPESRQSLIKANILDAIKRRDLILFEKTVQTYLLDPKELISTFDDKKSILHYIAESNFADGMALALEHIQHDHPSQASEALNIKDYNGETPAHICCIYDAVETLEVILKSGLADLSIKNNMDQTPQMLAYENDSLCLNILNQGNLSHTRDTSHQTLLPSSQLAQTKDFLLKVDRLKIESSGGSGRSSLQLRSVNSIKKEARLNPETRLFKIIENLIADRLNFIDEEFIHDNESIVNTESKTLQDLKDLDNVQWLRPADFMSQELSTNISLFEGIDLGSVSNSPLAGCDLYSALAVMVEHPQRLLKVFNSKEVNPQGAYSVSLLVSGVTVEILLDDYFPCSKDSQPLFSKTSNNELWFILTEKAFAKLYGTYTEIKNIQITDALEHITGMPTSQHSLRDMKMDELWALMLENDKKNYISCAGSFLTAGDPQKNRIFNISRLCETQQYRLIKLKNSFLDFEWNGMFDDNSKLWTKELKEEVGFFTGEKNCFFMEIKEFKKYFDFISVCYYNDSWARNSNEVTVDHKKETFFELDIDKEMDVFISVHQKLAQFIETEPGYDISPIDFLIAEEVENGSFKKIGNVIF